MVASEQFTAFFKKATGFSPYPYQQRWALDAETPSLVSIPTGMGKTAAAILGWVWRRRFADKSIRRATPRRLVYCLPMRVLVEQTIRNAEEWLTRLGLLSNGPEGGSESIRVYPLFGGDVENDWDFYPESESILVGTQDMLLSRALNRGYAMSRFRWPIHFALLNNDCLWVMDEVQLMGAGLASSVQLQAFRRSMGTISPVKSIWMSATIQKEWLETVDFEPEQDAPGLLELTEEDRQRPDVRQRYEAVKPIEKIAAADSKDEKKAAELILNKHLPGTLTLVVVNTVKRATKLYQALGKKEKDPEKYLLLHSRFRPLDRKAKLERLLDPPPDIGRIAVTTQVVEAGVDISAATLFTDLAPWPSMIQRFGRCNRKGEDDQARVFWFDLDISKKAAAAPYEAEEMAAAQGFLENLDGAGPDKLPDVCQDGQASLVLRRRDLTDLFDTTPDLAGADIDVSRFIRETDDHDVRVFWRDWEDDDPGPEEPGPSPDELCPAPIKDIKDIKGMEKVKFWRWDHQKKAWGRAETVFPGLVIMMKTEDGGYDKEHGWSGDKKKKPTPLTPKTPPMESINDDHWPTESDWQTLPLHTQAVIDELTCLLDHLGLTDQPGVSDLLQAARWHDAGKAHFVFQQAMITADYGDEDETIWAKAPRFEFGYERPGFRHELASALIMLQAGMSDLSAYLAAAHHGKVRLSIRSLPLENPPPDDSNRFARGVWEGDRVGPVDLGGGIVAPRTDIDLSCMELGDGRFGPSWLARMLAVRDDPALGPFNLAFLETLLRIADWRASARKGSKND